MRDGNLWDEYVALNQNSARHDNIYKRDFAQYDAAKVNRPLRDKAEQSAQQMGVALMRGKFGDVHDLKMDLLRLIEQMDPDTRKAFKQRLYLGRGSPAGNRAYDKAVPLIEVAALPQQDRAAYIALSEISNQCGRYADVPAAFEPMRVSITRKYTRIKPRVMAIYANASSPALQHEIEVLMDLVELTIGVGNSAQRRQRKTLVPVRKRRAPARARTTANRPSILDRAITCTGFKF